ncbi:MAG: ADP-ribosylglycohydrolase family protein [Deltaproteobacteria bacterium]|nr:ADP-ribosylglycohydrolase family protein [Deltaproteobacteria bacterium]
MLLKDRAAGCLLGLACGDAVGTTVEFSKPGSFPMVTDMVGGGPFQLKAGEWTDDTSMALCMATSLVKCNFFDPVDQMERYYRWYDTGYLSSNGKLFDIGKTVRLALVEFKKTGDPMSGSTDENSAGNGSIMRLAPIPIKYFPDKQKVIYYSGESSKTTHGANESVDACKLLGLLIYRALSGFSKKEILSSKGIDLDLTPKILEIAEGSYKKKSRKKIQGSGYVVESLEAALWCFYHSNSYKESILKAVNLGRDADTTAAICGQLSGAYWGKTGIPEEWLLKLVMRSEIENLALELTGTN